VDDAFDGLGRDRRAKPKQLRPRNQERHEPLSLHCRQQQPKTTIQRKVDLTAINGIGTQKWHLTTLEDDIMGFVRAAKL
jgi:hypothetical protein